VTQFGGLAPSTEIHQYVHGWAADSRNARLRLKGKIARANRKTTLLREEMRIKDARMKHLSPHQRPHYRPVERMSIFEMKASTL
jgi:hypothetical protein